jgi:hypothetical protein
MVHATAKDSRGFVEAKQDRDIVSDGLDKAMSKVFLRKPDGGGNVARFYVENPKVNMQNPFWQRWSTPRYVLQRQERGEE